MLDDEIVIGAAIAAVQTPAAAQCDTLVYLSGIALFTAEIERAGIIAVVDIEITARFVQILF